MTRRKDVITARLLGLGWRFNVTADGECGAVGERTGYCERVAKWERRGSIWCAAHALQASRSRGER